MLSRTTPAVQGKHHSQIQIEQGKNVQILSLIFAATARISNRMLTEMWEFVGA